MGEKTAREHSAGGVAVRGNQVLLVRVRNLRGEYVWTFPKGHVEEGETPAQAARREVEEETGYRCRILSRVMVSRYSFRHSNRCVNKKVDWFWMKPTIKLGRPDKTEVYAVRWVSFAKAGDMVLYPSDRELVRRGRRRERS